MNKDRIMNAVGPKVKKSGLALEKKVKEAKANVAELETTLTDVEAQEAVAIETLKHASNSSFETLTEAHATIAAADTKRRALKVDLGLVKEKLGYAQNGYNRWYQSLSNIVDLRHSIALELEYYAAYDAWCKEVLNGKKNAVKPRMGPITRSLQDQRWLETQVTEGETA